MKKGPLELTPLTARREHQPEPEKIQVASNNISGGALSPQHSRSLRNILLELDEAKATSLLASTEGSSPRLPSPFTGRLLNMHFDPVEVLELVDSIWPSRVQGHPCQSKRPKGSVTDRLLSPSLLCP